MVNVSFSLTEKFIIHPVLSMRASLPIDPANPPGIKTRIIHHINAEGTARVISAFASVFAAADFAIHTASGIYKGSHFLLRKMNSTCLDRAPWSSQEVRDHFAMAGKFALLAVIGSVAGAIWPDVFKFFLPSPSDIGNDDDESWTKAPEDLLQLVEAVKNGEEQAPYNQLRKYWEKASLGNKHWFVKIFGSDKSDMFAAVRVELASMVYRHIDQPSNRLQLHNRRLTWHSGAEIDARISSLWERAKEYNKGFLFHATSERNLESILKGRKVEVRHEKLYRGAFVSTRPEITFGPCVLVFRRNIERLSHLEHGFMIGQRTYWAGFSRDIPVTDETLAYIILNDSDESKRLELEKNCEAWTGRKINVISHRNIEERLETVERLDMGIPIEWPDEGEKVGLPILHHLRATHRTQLAQAVAAPQRVSICARVANRIRMLGAQVPRIEQTAQEMIQNPGAEPVSVRLRHIVTERRVPAYQQRPMMMSYGH